MEKDFGIELLGSGYNEKSRSVIVNFVSDRVTRDWEYNCRNYCSINKNEDENLLSVIGAIAIVIAEKLNIKQKFESETNKFSFIDESGSSFLVPLACNILSSILTRQCIRQDISSLFSAAQNTENEKAIDRLQNNMLTYLNHDTTIWEIRHEFYKSLQNNYEWVIISMADENYNTINCRPIVRRNEDKISSFGAQYALSYFDTFFIKDDYDLFVTSAEKIKLRIIQPAFQGKPRWYGYFIEKEPVYEKIDDKSFNNYFIDPDRENIYSEIEKDINAIRKIKIKDYYGYYDIQKSKNLTFSIPTEPKEQDAATQNMYEENKCFINLIKEEKIFFNITSELDGDIVIFLKTRKLDDESYALKRSKSQKIQYVNEINKVSEYSYEEKGSDYTYEKTTIKTTINIERVLQSGKLIKEREMIYKNKS